jgi:rhomboid family protein
MANFDSPMRRTTPVIFNLLIINILVFIIQCTLNKTDFVNFERLGALYYYKSSFFHPYQFITSMFMHANIEHIAFNMFGLWMFGSILEKYWGSKRFLIFYLICGIGAGLLEQLLTPYSAIQIAKASDEYLSGQYSLDAVIQGYKEFGYSIGASGAIMGVLAAFAYLFPNTELYVLFIPIPIKAKYVIPFFILFDLFGGLYHIKGDDIAHFAHLGGALVGFLLVFFWNRSNKKNFY